MVNTLALIPHPPGAAARRWPAGSGMYHVNLLCHPDWGLLKPQAVAVWVPGICHRLAVTPGRPKRIGFDFWDSRDIIVSVLAGADACLWSEGIYRSLGETA